MGQEGAQNTGRREVVVKIYNTRLVQSFLVISRPGQSQGLLYNTVVGNSVSQSVSQSGF